MKIGKKLKVSSIAAMLLGSCVAANAVDVKANIMMHGDLMRVEKDKSTGDKEWAYLLNEQVKQIDNPGDGIILSVDDGLIGAQLALWYKSATATGENEWQAYFRRSFLWFKPIDSLKIRLGYVGNDTFFKEKIDEWKVGSPFAVTERDWAKHPAYINCNDVEGWGFGVEYRPIDQLVLNAGITPGKQGHVDSNEPKDIAGIYKKDGDSKTYIAPWGLGAKYYWNKFEFQASFRNGGRDKTTRNGTWSVARFGVGYSDDKTYSFIQPILGLDYNTADEKWELNGMCLDLYSEFFFDAWTFMFHAPVTLRWGDADTDVNYMEANLKVKYNTGSHGNLDDVAPYIQLGSNQDDAIWGNTLTRVWLLDKHFADSFNLTYKAGVNFKISAAELDLGVKVNQFSDYHKAEYGKSWGVSVPFSVKIKNF